MDDVPSIVQAESSSFPWGLCGEERFEDFLVQRRRNTAAGIADSNLDDIGHHPRFRRQRSADIFHGLAGGRHAIHHHLYELVPVATDGGPLAIVLDHVDIMEPRGVTGYFERLVEFTIDRNQASF